MPTRSLLPPSRPIRTPGSGPRSRSEALSRLLLPQLREGIISGRYPPGSRLVERQLCDDYGVSRTPLREVLKILAAEGLVELSQNRGARVAPLRLEEARRLFEVLAELEGLAAAWTAEHASADTLAALRRDHDAMHALAASGDSHGYFALNTAFHEAVAAASGNHVLADLVSSLTRRSLRWRYQAIVGGMRHAEGQREHDALMLALEARDSAAARAIWSRHVAGTGQLVAEPDRDDGDGRHGDGSGLLQDRNGTAGGNGPAGDGVDGRAG